MEGVFLGRGLGHHGNLVDGNFQDVLQKILGDILVAEDLGKHEIVGNVQVFVPFHLIAHFSSSRYRL